MDTRDGDLSSPATFEPDWYPDPFRRHEYRYHDGRRWTADVATGGVRSVDPPEWTLRDRDASGSDGAPGDSAALTALVFGIAGVCLAWLPFLVVAGAVCGLGALVAARRAARRHTVRRSAHASAGRVLGVVALVLVVPGVALTRMALGVLSPGPHLVEVTSCTSDAGRAVLRGTITNLSDSDRGYLVLVRFARSGTGGVIADEMVQIDEVSAGATMDLVAAVSSDIASVDCTVLGVLGGIPFDIS